MAGRILRHRRPTESRLAQRIYFMNIDHLEIFVEEPSMEAFLQQFLPGTLPDHVTYTIHTHNGKHNLLKNLPFRLRGLKSWMPENYGVIIIVDKDNDDCTKLKLSIEEHLINENIPTKSNPTHGLYIAASCIAVEELEAWYFGNWYAVTKAFPAISPSIPNKAAYRQCDFIQGGTWEAFERVCKNYGIFSSGLRKVEAARTIGAEIEISRNQSPSFEYFYQCIQSLVAIH